MGFLDKAKKMAEQAQSEIERRSRAGANPVGPPPVEYDQHGRPIRTEAPAEPSGAPAEPAAPPAEPVGPPPAAPTPPHGDPLAQQEPAPPQPPPAAPAPDPAAPPSREDDEYAPPKLTGGDPLAG